MLPMLAGEKLVNRKEELEKPSARLILGHSSMKLSSDWACPHSDGLSGWTFRASTEMTWRRLHNSELELLQTWEQVLLQH